MSRAISPATTTSTTTVLGEMNPNTATFGIRAKLGLTGLPTATAIGIGSAPGAGPGLITRRGALLLTTMAAGTISQAAGDGAQARIMLRRAMDQLSWASLAVALALASAGSHWAGASLSTPGLVAAIILSP